MVSTLHTAAVKSVKLAIEAVSDDSLGVVVRKITKQDHVEDVCAQYSPFGVIETSNPWPALDVFPCIPHEDESNGLASGRGCNVVACEGLHLSSTSCDEPHLRENCNRAKEEACHPKGVEQRAVVLSSVEERRKNHCDLHQGPGGKRILLSLICVTLHEEHLMEQPSKNANRGDIDCLEDMVASEVGWEVSVQPQGGRQATAKSSHFQSQGACRNASNTASRDDLQGKQCKSKALDQD